MPRPAPTQRRPRATDIRRIAQGRIIETRHPEDDLSLFKPQGLFPR